MKRNVAFLLALTFLTAFSCERHGGGDTGGGEDKPSSTVSAPSNIALESSGEGTLLFRWDAVKGARIYIARLSDASGAVVSGGQKNVMPSATDSDGRLSVSYDGLAAGTYGFAVKVTTTAGTSDYSNTLQVVLEKGPGGGDEPGGNTGADETLYGTPEEIYAAMMIPSREEDGVVRAFPGAEGCGMLTTGGRGGKVYHVTSLEDDPSKEGTLRYAVNQKGARIVVFDVAGTIALNQRLEIKNPDITIAGQTAPGDGICIRNYNVRINTGNVILRYLRFRMGDEKASEDDALNCYTGDGCFKNIIIDHCSMSWSTDECASFYGVEDFTLQYCIISESLRISVHGKGQHGYGGLWGGANASYHHNLLAHHDSRNPRFGHDYLNPEKGPIHYYNNVVYNWYGNSAYGGESGAGESPRQINFVANYYKPGPSSSNRTRLVNPTTKCKNCNASNEKDVVPGKFHVADNYMCGSAEVTADNWLGVQPDDKTLLGTVKAESYMGARPARIQTAEAAFETVLACAGASLHRDNIDKRITNETRNGTCTFKGSKSNISGIIDTQADVGGWPVYSATSKQIADVFDSDGDGIPDWWEVRFGLDRLDASDASKIAIDLRGRYSNLEMYLHYLVRETVAAQ